MIHWAKLKRVFKIVGFLLKPKDKECILTSPAIRIGIWRALRNWCSSVHVFLSYLFVPSCRALSLLFLIFLPSCPLCSSLSPSVWPSGQLSFLSYVRCIMDAAWLADGLTFKAKCLTFIGICWMLRLLWVSVDK